MVGTHGRQVNKKRDGRDLYFIKSVNRCFSLLEHIGGAPRGEATVRKLSRSLGIPEASATKILTTLEMRNFIEREAPAGPYRLGHRTLMLQEAFLQRQRKQKMRDIRPFLERLAEETGETVYFAAFGVDGPVCEDVVESGQPVRVVCKRGTLLPLEATAVGKVMLAYSGISTRFREEIEARGYAVNMGESDPDITGVAAPVYNHASEVKAVIGIAGPTFRLGQERVDAGIAPALVKAAGDLSQRLGFRGN